MIRSFVSYFGLIALYLTVAVSVALCDEPQVETVSAFHFIDTSYENASRVHWDINESDTNTVHVFLQYDHERDAVNRAAGHWRFRLEAEQGSSITLVLHNFDNIWNGHHGSPVSDKTVCYLSEDGNSWRPIETEWNKKDRSLSFTVEMRSDVVEIARLPPYTQENLDQLINTIKRHHDVSVDAIGQTVQGRILKMIRVGKVDAPHCVVLRARAHPWETGGNWVTDGLIRRLVEPDAQTALFREQYVVYVMPFANMDGVVAGLTRFNVRGKDLNRNWDKPADPDLAPENAALEKWIEKMIKKGRKPDLLIDFHNDEDGRLHLSHPGKDGSEGYIRDMARLEDLLRKHTVFREGHTSPSFHNPGSIGEGLLSRYAVTAVVHELNANIVAGADAPPGIDLWRGYGRGLALVFHDYFTD